MRRDPHHPWSNPAIAVELSMRERSALMTPDDWDEQLDVILAKPPQPAVEGGETP